MSSPQNDGPSLPVEEKKKGFEKYVAKFKKALGRSDSTATKRLSTAPARPTAAASSSKPTAAAAAPTKPAPPKGPDVVNTIPIDLGTAAERVEKPIRMRIHRECHECKTGFGSEKTCTKCDHKRCRECPRYPPKKNKGDKGKKFEHGDVTVDLVDEKGAKIRLQITKPAKVGGQNLVLKRPVQRVRRNCHTCGTLFVAGTKTCGECGHVRCTDCPRDPPKARKYPYGYPNDVPGEKNPYFSCHACAAVFPLGESACAACGHAKCEQCARTTPKKVVPAQDPDVLRRVEERLAALNLGGRSVAA